MGCAQSMIVRALWLGSDRSGTRSRLCNDEPGAGKCAPMREMLRCAPASSPDIRDKAPLGWSVRGPVTPTAVVRWVIDGYARAAQVGTGQGAGSRRAALEGPCRTGGLPGCRKRNLPRAYGSSPAGCVRASRTAAGASSLRRRRGAVAERVSERRRHPGLSAVRRTCRAGRGRGTRQGVRGRGSRRAGRGAEGCAGPGAGERRVRVYVGEGRVGLGAVRRTCRAGRGRATRQGVRGRGARRAERGAEGCAGPGAGERRVSVNVDEGRVGLSAVRRDAPGRARASDASA